MDLKKVIPKLAYFQIAHLAHGSPQITHNWVSANAFISIRTLNQQTQIPAQTSISNLTNQ